MADAHPSPTAALLVGALMPGARASAVHAARRMFSLVAPRARLERATYCLGGTTAPALYRPATTHVTSERNSQRQLLSERS
jgi:hypothetical protein